MSAEDEKKDYTLKNKVEKAKEEWDPLTPSEKETMEYLVAEFGQEKLDSLPFGAVIRFIRGYCLEKEPVKTTIEHLRDFIKWREEEKVDEIIDNPPKKLELFRKLWPAGIHGTTRDGHLVYVERLGKLDVSEVSKNFTDEELMRCHVYQLEMIGKKKAELAARPGAKMMYKQMVILDLDGFSMGHLSSRIRGAVQSFMSVDQHMYPESLLVMHIVNAPFVFRAAWALVSPLLHPLTKARIKMGGHDIAKFANTNNVPRFIKGSTCKCEGGKCLMVDFVEGDAEDK
eukprot:TRINITY_DN66830_c6_g2_i1.p2 TRINITY_DN66830_c6_g2~~TRINITY_DN66830_c6_g2_i1.p2  ORF type:complete len:285 (-),score=138.92 TRINITY_DN66830_c6_g2_i1:138-992(-)